MEFGADRYISLHLEHHFDGLFFNMIPWVNRLKLREVVFARGFYGAISAHNSHGEVRLPYGLKGTDVPYVEVGFGIENIFKIASVNFSWRVTQTDQPDILRFIVKPGYNLRF
jgi:hypothetical protein